MRLFVISLQSSCNGRRLEDHAECCTIKNWIDLSSYSQSLTRWKDALFLNINQFLMETHASFLWGQRLDVLPIVWSSVWVVLTCLKLATKPSERTAELLIIKGWKVALMQHSCNTTTFQPLYTQLIHSLLTTERCEQVRGWWLSGYTYNC